MGNKQMLAEAFPERSPDEVWARGFKGLFPHDRPSIPCHAVENEHIMKRKNDEIQKWTLEQTVHKIWDAHRDFSAEVQLHVHRQLTKALKDQAAASSSALEGPTEQAPHAKSANQSQLD